MNHNSPKPRLSYDKKAITELGSVTKLQDMLAETGEIIPYINRGDREPGQDGHIFVLGKGSQYPIGRFIVQVKSISVDPQGEGVISIHLEEEHLRYYESEDSPFLYIVVDRDKNVAFWKYTSPGWVDRHEINKGKSIRFDSANKISYTDTDYVDEFRAKLEEHRSIYARKCIPITEKALKEFIEAEDYQRAIHKLRLELDDAGRSVCRSRGIEPPHYAKMRGVLGRNGFLAANDEDCTEEMHTMSPESFYGRLYRGIVDIDDGVAGDGDDSNIETILEDGLDLLEHLYRQQMNPDFVSDGA